ncbi:hypothetical protein ACFW0P_10915 [Lysobacter soli]|uniref:hypothetical protein n=1 Tax=Lysobacter soli TaxID=453783 RepID=UPI0036CDCC30
MSDADTDYKKLYETLRVEIKEISDEEDKRNRKRQEARTRQFQLMVSLLALVLGIIPIASFSFYTLTMDRAGSTASFPFIRRAPPVQSAAPSIDAMQAQLAKLSKAVSGMQANLSYSKPGTITTVPSAEDVSAEIKALAARLDRIERAIGNDPERALTIPLLRRDLDHVSGRFEEFRTTTEQSVRATQESVANLIMRLLIGAGVLILAGLGGIGRLVWVKISPKTVD